MKCRDPYLCNGKALLIFLVIFGHALEGDIGWNAGAAFLYRVLYSFHMPLFAFFSGIGMVTLSACLAQARKMLRRYLALQLLLSLPQIFHPAAFLSGLFTPFWILWYLLSLGCWCLLAAGIQYLSDRSAGRFPAVLLVPLSAAASLLWGLVPWIGRIGSLSRTLVFFPFFLVGKLWGWQLLTTLRRRRCWAVPALAAAGLLLALLRGCPAGYFYQADSYAALGCSPAEGILFRFCFLLTAISLSLLFLSLCPRGRTVLTAAGNQTFLLFLCHPLFTLPLKWLPYPPHLAVPAALLTAASAFLSLSLLGKWSRRLVRYQPLRHPAPTSPLSF